MKIDDCDTCGQNVFFENTKCLKCGHGLAFFATEREMCSLEPAGGGLWRRANVADAPAHRLCANSRDHQVCNWVVRANDPNPLCVSCRLTRVIPDLSRPAAVEAWGRLETAKRRLVYSLLALDLPIKSKTEDPDAGLAFEFLADPDPDDTDATAVLTGHDNGVIVINIAEADDVERERRRTALHEPYRTLLGHFRHEIGHYYWDRLIAGTPRLEKFRALFGDESVDYGEALNRHYQNGAPADWSQRFISAYASSHPWEDWAETWAHFLHMIDSVETARSLGLKFRPTNRSAPSVNRDAFEAALSDWLSLTCVLNNLNRGLGFPDGYPFVVTDPVVAKLRFIHDVVANPSAPLPMTATKTM